MPVRELMRAAPCEVKMAGYWLSSFFCVLIVFVENVYVVQSGDSLKRSVTVKTGPFESFNVIHIACK